MSGFTEFPWRSVVVGGAAGLFLAAMDIIQPYVRERTWDITRFSTLLLSWALIMAIEFVPAVRSAVPWMDETPAFHIKHPVWGTPLMLVGMALVLAIIIYLLVGAIRRKDYDDSR